MRATKLIERSTNISSDRIVRFGDFEFNTENKRLTNHGETVVLSSTETDLLTIFCNHINEPIDRFKIAEEFNNISERSIDVQVTRLRKKIEDDPKTPMFIQTSRGKGYVFRV